MKKTLLAALAFASLFVVFASARYATPADSRLGGKAPGFALAEGDSATTRLQDYCGKYVLLTFWSSTDPQSRIANIKYDRATRADSTIAYVAINYDPSGAVYSEIVKRDSLAEASQHHDSAGTASRIYKAYGLTDGFTSVLIAPTGRIVAVDPAPGELAGIAAR